MPNQHQFVGAMRGHSGALNIPVVTAGGVLSIAAPDTVAAAVAVFTMLLVGLVVLQRTLATFVALFAKDPEQAERALRVLGLLQRRAVGVADQPNRGGDEAHQSS